MPIPALTAEGLLPPGVHDCTMEEIQQRFGSFQGSDRRPNLFARLEACIVALRRSGILHAVVVDGSFVTSKAQPDDIDVVLVLKAGHNFLAQLTPDQYNLVQTHVVRRQFGFDSLVAEDGTEDYATAVEFFQRVKQEPDGKKGILRISL